MTGDNMEQAAFYIFMSISVVSLLAWVMFTNYLATKYGIAKKLADIEIIKEETKRLELIKAIADKEYAQWESTT